MKCDHIRTREQGDTPFFPNMLNNANVEVCLKEDVYAAIAELKQKLHDAEMRADLAECAETERRIDYDNLKKDLAYHARQIYFKHHRQTLRALWLARANRAKAESQTRVSHYAFYRWKDVEQLCRAKADTFKENV